MMLSSDAAYSLGGEVEASTLPHAPLPGFPCRTPSAIASNRELAPKVQIVGAACRYGTL